MNNKLSIIVVNYNTRHLLDQFFNCLIPALKGISYQIIFIDNASKDDSVDFLINKYPDITLIESKVNLGFGRANNLAIEKINYDYVLLLNTDAFVSKDSIKQSLDLLIGHPETGVLGVKLKSRDGTIQPSRRYFPTPFNIFLNRTGLFRFFNNVTLVDLIDWNPDDSGYCDWVPGCFYLTRKNLIDKYGLFDPRYFLYYEEVDHCHMLKSHGYKVFYYSGVDVIHIGGESAKIDNELTSTGSQVEKLQVESELLYFRKNHGLFILVLHILLVIIADLLILSKNLVGFKKLHFVKLLCHSWLYFRLLFLTRFGVKPIH